MRLFSVSCGSGTQLWAPLAEALCEPVEASVESMAASPTQVLGWVPGFQAPVKGTGVLA